jgi:hypothetical protein
LTDERREELEREALLRRLADEERIEPPRLRAPELLARAVELRDRSRIGDEMGNGMETGINWSNT